MKKLLIALLFALYSPLINSQIHDNAPLNDSNPQYVKLTIRSAPKWTFEFNGHYDFGMYELSGNDNGDFISLRFYNGENFGVRHGIGGTAAIKYSIQENGHLRLFLSGSYNRFNSKYNKYLNDVNEKDFAIYNVFCFSAGIENSFTPGFEFKPLVGFGFVGSIISGDARVNDKNVTVYRYLKINPAFRLGLTFYSGLEYLINNHFGVNCGIKIVHANLWLKNSKVSNNPDEIYLNDDRVFPKIPFSGYRQFVWGSLYGGVNIYFGINQKDYYYRK